MQQKTELLRAKTPEELTQKMNNFHETHTYIVAMSIFQDETDWICFASAKIPGGTTQ